MITPTISQVRVWAANGHALADAASMIDGAVDAFDSEMNTLTRDVDEVSEVWRGMAARASAVATDSERQFSNRLGMALIDITDDINRLGPAFVRACETATATAESVAALGYVVADDGAVSAPAESRGGCPADLACGADASGARALAEASAAVHQRNLRRELAEAGVADADLARQIGAAADGLDRAADRATTPGAVRPAVRRILDDASELPRDPRELKAMWDALTATEKAELWNHDRSVGNMDGIPVADRDHFNRRHLVEMQRGARAQVAAYLAAHPDMVDGRMPHFPGPGGYVVENRRRRELDAVTREHRALVALQDALDDPSHTDPRQLMFLDDHGRVAIAVNNPDTAANVATYVPGTGSGVGNVAGGVARSQAMVNAAEGVDRAAATSVVAWYAYDAPANLAAAAGPASAAHAAGPLDAFQTGLRATHEGATASHNTVVGHSYGTVVVGEAASEGHVLDADDLVFVASPGVGGPDSPDDLRLTHTARGDMDDHVYATTAPNDPIGLVEGIHGPSPADADFGARRFDSDAGDVWDGGAHSRYWDVRTDGTPGRSLSGMGLIIAGRGDEAVAGSPSPRESR